MLVKLLILDFNLILGKAIKARFNLLRMIGHQFIW